MTKDKKTDLKSEDDCISDISGMNCEDVTHFPFGEIIEKIRSVSERERKDLLTFCETLDASKLNKNLPLRLAIVRIVAALLPLSLPLLTRWLQNRRLREIHFTAFCYIDWVGELPEGDVSRVAVLKLVEDYLTGTNSEAASAAWMAGDLLGDHWPIAESLPVLRNILQRGRYIAGRNAARHGIEMTLKRSDLALNDREKLIVSLEAHKTKAT